MFRRTLELLAELRVLSGDTNRAGVEMAMRMLVFPFQNIF